MQNHLWNSKHKYNSIKEQSSILCATQLPLPHKLRGQTDISREIFNAGENCIAISNNREAGNEIYGPYVKLSGWNRNRIQQLIRSNSEVLALLIHATTLDEPFHIGDHT